jgi:hypothetical protein
MKQLISVAISFEHATNLEKEVFAKEIKDMLFHMKANKIPGPNGFSADFFKASWTIVGQEVVDAFKGLFDSSSLLREVNATIISLVPKKVNPFAMGDFRPIACCNVIYKCITRILSNRMLPFLSDLVSKTSLLSFLLGVYLKMFYWLRNLWGVIIRKKGILDAL